MQHGISRLGRIAGASGKHGLCAQKLDGSRQVLRWSAEDSYERGALALLFPAAHLFLTCLLLFCTHSPPSSLEDY